MKLRNSYRKYSLHSALSIGVEEWLEIARNVMPIDPFIHDAVFSWMHSMVLCGGYSLQPLYRRFLSMIECGHPSIAYYNFIEAFAAHLSIPDQLVKTLLSSMRYPLCKQVVFIYCIGSCQSTSRVFLQEINAETIRL